jgi:hypothetical protein
MKSFTTKCLVGVLCVGTFACLAYAQTAREMAARDKQARSAAAESIVVREEVATGRSFDSSFRAQVLTELASKPQSELDSILSKGEAGLGLLAQGYGSTQADLVYTPVTPCRIIDTRLAGGPIGAGSQRSFLATGNNYSGQGGFAGSCGVPNGPATAIAVNLTVVGPPGAGDLRAFPYGAAVPLASVLNYVPGDTLANGINLTICDPSQSTCGFDFTVQSDGSVTDLVADVQGYYSVLPSTLASGKTVVGTYGIDFVASVAGTGGPSAISFPLPLASAPTPQVIAAGGAPTTNCPGSSANPTAAAGQFCVYESSSVNVSSRCVSQVASGWSCGAASAFGGVVWISATAAGRAYSVGTWAVKAP